MRVPELEEMGAYKLYFLLEITALTSSVVRSRFDQSKFCVGSTTEFQVYLHVQICKDKGCGVLDGMALKDQRLALFRLSSECVIPSPVVKAMLPSGLLKCWLLNFDKHNFE